MKKTDKLREVRFTPYLKGCGPRFTLRTYYLGTEKIGYEFLQHENGETTVLFEGEDFRPSPLQVLDSDESIKSLMTFLTLRPGDTDAEYFESYTQTQLQYCMSHAEALSSYCYFRFGE